MSTPKKFRRHKKNDKRSEREFDLVCKRARGVHDSHTQCIKMDRLFRSSWVIGIDTEAGDMVGLPDLD